MTGAWFCIVCPETGAGPKFDLEARKHTEATGHGTSTSHHPPIALSQCIDEVREQLEKRGDLTPAERKEELRRKIAEQTKRRPIPAAVREAVFDRDGHTCLSCGSTENLSLDHITPLSRGGTDEISNLQTLCVPCNSRKADAI